MENTEFTLKFEEKRPVEDRRRWYDNIKVDHTVI
jgi:hypothetical protein